MTCGPLRQKHAAYQPGPQALDTMHHHHTHCKKPIQFQHKSIPHSLKTLCTISLPLSSDPGCRVGGDQMRVFSETHNPRHNIPPLARASLLISPHICHHCHIKCHHGAQRWLSLHPVFLHHLATDEMLLDDPFQHSGRAAVVIDAPTLHTHTHTNSHIQGRGHNQWQRAMAETIDKQVIDGNRGASAHIHRMDGCRAVALRTTSPLSDKTMFQNAIAFDSSQYDSSKPSYPPPRPLGTPLQWVLWHTSLHMQHQAQIIMG